METHPLHIHVDMEKTFAIYSDVTAQFAHAHRYVKLAPTQSWRLSPHRNRFVFSDLFWVCFFFPDSAFDFNQPLHHEKKNKSNLHHIPRKFYIIHWHITDIIIHSCVEGINKEEISAWKDICSLVDETEARQDVKHNLRGSPVWEFSILTADSSNWLLITN